MNPPESRERTAEVMFESFGVAGLYIGVQAVLALAGSFASQGLSGRPLTGTVVDSGDGVTHVVPVVDGFVAGSCVRSLPLAGASVTSFVQRLLRERGEPIPPELSMEAARQVKEAHCYVCQDMAKEFARHEDDPKKHHRKHSMADPRSGQDVSFDVGYERFLGPEIFFTPEIVNESVSPLPRVRGEPRPVPPSVPGRRRPPTGLGMETRRLGRPPAGGFLRRRPSRAQPRGFPAHRGEPRTPRSASQRARLLGRSSTMRSRDAGSTPGGPSTGTSCSAGGRPCSETLAGG